MKFINPLSPGNVYILKVHFFQIKSQDSTATANSILKKYPLFLTEK